ncbi:MAG: hypothetical protein EA397_18980 [Deltaproteobacteria bacterium]|nr:MAG: hypothetical protein EA397_18980 [Deltaproteobacteria bacterium]
MSESLAHARAELVEAHHAAADAAHAQGEWRACFDALDRAEAVQPNHEATRTRQPVCAEPLLTEIRAHLDKGAEVRAYPLVHALGERLPEHPEIPALRTASRELARSRAANMAELGAWVEAIEALSVIDEYQPDQANATEVLRRDLKTRWASELREQVGLDQARGELGAAFIRQAKAAWLSELSTDRTRREQLRRELLDRYGLRVDLTIQGTMPAALHEAVQRGFGERVPLSEGLSSPSLSLTLRVEPGTCTERRHTEIGEAEVERGREPYDNPDWLAAHNALTRLQDRLSIEEGSLREAHGVLEEHQRRLNERTEAMTRAMQEIDRARAARDERHNLLQQASAEWSGAAEAFASGQDRSGAALEPARLAWVDAERAFRKSEDALSKARKSHLQATEAFQRSFDALRQAVEDSDRQQARVQGLREQVVERSGHLESIPMVAYRPLIETLRYPIHTVTTRCEHSLTFLERGTAPVRLEEVAEVSANTHGAIVEAGLAELPYQAPATEQELLDASLEALAEKVEGTARARAQRWRKTQLRLAAQGRRSTDDASLARRIAVYLHDPSSPPDDLLPLLQDVFGIEKLTLLLQDDQRPMQQ